MNRSAPRSAPVLPLPRRRPAPPVRRLRHRCGAGAEAADHRGQSRRHERPARGRGPHRGDGGHRRGGEPGMRGPAAHGARARLGLPELRRGRRPRGDRACRRPPRHRPGPHQHHRAPPWAGPRSGTWSPTTPTSSPRRRPSAATATTGCGRSQAASASTCTRGRKPPGSPARPPSWWTTCGTRRCGSSTASGTAPSGAACPWRTRARWRSCWPRGGSPTPTPRCPAPATTAAPRRSGSR